MKLKQTGLVLLLATSLSTANCGRTEKTMDLASPDYWLENYRWFKQQKAAIEQVDHTMQAQRASIEKYRNDFEEMPRSEWPRDARQTLDEKETTLEGYTRQYNALVADYTARANDITRMLAERPVTNKIAFKDSVEVAIRDIKFKTY